MISRLRNCVLALSEHQMMLYDTSVLYCYEESQRFHVSTMVPLLSGQPF